jgi:hypothetical protein
MEKEGKGNMGKKGKGYWGRRERDGGRRERENGVKGKERMCKKGKGEKGRRERENGEKEKGERGRRERDNGEEEKGRMGKKRKGEWGRRKGRKELVERTRGVRYTYSSFSDFFSTKSYLFINPISYMYFRELYSVTEATGFFVKIFINPALLIHFIFILI